MLTGDLVCRWRWIVNFISIFWVKRTSVVRVAGSQHPPVGDLPTCAAFVPTADAFPCKLPQFPRRTLSSAIVCRSCDTRQVPPVGLGKTIKSPRWDLCAQHSDRHFCQMWDLIHLSPTGGTWWLFFTSQVPPVGLVWYTFKLTALKYSKWLVSCWLNVLLLIEALNFWWP